MGKGADWERETAKLLSLWWTEGDADDVIYRTSASGARATQRRKSGKGTTNSAGDLGFTDDVAKPLFQFMTMECKRGYTTVKDKATGKRVPATPSQSINILYWLDRPVTTKPPLLYQWWHKLSHDRRASGSHWQAIIFRRTGKRKTIMMEYEMFSQLCQYQDNYTDMAITISLPFANHPWPEERYTFLDLEYFLEWLTPQTILQLLEDYGGPLEPKIQKRQLR